MKKIYVFIVLLIFFQLSSFPQCLPDGITFTTQEQIDNFQTDYPGCTEVMGNVIIESEIFDLSGLNVLTSIGGNLNINSNWYLTNLSGLDNLSYVGGDLEITFNEALTTLVGLEALSSINGNFIFENNPTPTSLSGFAGLNSIGGSLKISGNYALSSLTGLENLSSIGGDLFLDYNTALNSFAALNSLASVAGDIHIQENPITNLIGLENIESFNGILQIEANYYLEDLSALNGLDSIKGLFLSMNYELPSLSGLESLTQVGGLIIDYNPLLANLSGLDNLKYIENGLFINYNENLTSLSGLENLDSIGGRLEFWENQILSNLDGLDSLISLDGDLIINYNYALNNIAALENLNAAKINDVSIVDNSSLSLCDIQSLCDYLNAPNGTVDIHGNASGCENLIAVANNCGTTLSCLPYGNYYFDTQEDIDNFAINYPGCLNLGGSVFISGDDITNLNGLNGIASLEGGLIIRNTSLTNLSGLDSISTIGGGCWIYNNATLTSMTGFEKLTEIGGHLLIQSNVSLVSLNGLNSLNSIEGDFNLWYNPILSNLNGLDNVSTLGNNLYIAYNYQLNDLTALANSSSAATIQNRLDIYYNQSLSSCDIQLICDLLDSNVITDIHNNAPGCNSQTEIEEACNTFTQNISLTSGWNIASFNVVPDQIRMDSILKPLMNSNTLVKVVNESGGFIQYIPGLGWLNTIGNMAATEGYYTKVNANSQINLTGLAVSTPFDITLNLGWNIMGYPLNQSQNALTALQALTDNNQLVKVVNESGGFIQYIPGLGWLNTIGNFAPGEGYYIKVSANTSISLDLPPLLKVTPDVVPTPPVTLFSLPFENNPYYPMNILVTDISIDGIEVKEGDELAVYDKGLCVGAGVVVSYRGILLAHIIASMDDPLTELKDGYKEGNTISFRYASKAGGQQKELFPSFTWGSENFEQLGTMVCTLTDNALSIVEQTNQSLYLTCYPNPVTGELTIDYILSEEGKVQLEMMDIYGKRMMLIEEATLQKGIHQAKADMMNLNNGIYILRLNFEEKNKTSSLLKKVVKQ